MHRVYCMYTILLEEEEDLCAKRKGYEYCIRQSPQHIHPRGDLMYTTLLGYQLWTEKTSMVGQVVRKPIGISQALQQGKSPISFLVDEQHSAYRYC